MAPAPPPAWWNTVDEEEILWLDGPFSERDLSWQQGSWDGETRWVTGWYPWPRTFVSVGREAVSEKFIRTPENQDQTFRVNLVSRQTVTVKQCYYRAYYDVEWNSFEGAWVGVGPNGGFRFYRSSCYRSTNYGPREEDLTRQVSVRFASSGKPILPWEQELFRVTFDGRNVGVFPVNTNSGPSYEYQPISNDGYSVVLQPGRKLLNSPFPGGVNLRVEPTSDGRGFRLQVIDWWTDYYDKIPGETLELYVLIEDATGLQRDLFEYSKRNPLRLVTYQQRDIQKSSGEAENPKTLEIRGPWQADWLSPGSKPRRQYNVTWSFRRTGSNISNGSWIDKGRIFVQF
ncbi:MAG: hypothetical protein HY402_03885 [Elusimicrobia bacterium]|nr:hypothetical protein [Elusimicrobiota bacterium]